MNNVINGHLDRLESAASVSRIRNDTSSTVLPELNVQPAMVTGTGIHCPFNMNYSR